MVTPVVTISHIVMPVVTMSHIVTPFVTTSYVVTPVLTISHIVTPVVTTSVSVCRLSRGILVSSEICLSGPCYLRPWFVGRTCHTLYRRHETRVAAEFCCVE